MYREKTILMESAVPDEQQELFDRMLEMYLGRFLCPRSWKDHKWNYAVTGTRDDSPPLLSEDEKLYEWKLFQQRFHEALSALDAFDPEMLPNHPAFPDPISKLREIPFRADSEDVFFNEYGQLNIVGWGLAKQGATFYPLRNRNGLDEFLRKVAHQLGLKVNVSLGNSVGSRNPIPVPAIFRPTQSAEPNKTSGADKPEKIVHKKSSEKMPFPWGRFCFSCLLFFITGLGLGQLFSLKEASDELKYENTLAIKTPKPPIDIPFNPTATPQPPSVPRQQWVPGENRFISSDSKLGFYWLQNGSGETKPKRVIVVDLTNNFKDDFVKNYSIEFPDSALGIQSLTSENVGRMFIEVNLEPSFLNLYPYLRLKANSDLKE